MKIRMKLTQLICDEVPYYAIASNATLTGQPMVH